MRIHYLLGQDFPDQQTQGIQVMNMGTELARLGVRTRLLVHQLHVEDREELFGHFGLKPQPGFTIHGFRRAGIRMFNHWRGPAFAARLTKELLRHGGPEPIVYSRGQGGIEPTRVATAVGRAFDATVVYEVHKFYAEVYDQSERYDMARREGGKALRRKRRHRARIRWSEPAMLRGVDGLVCITRGIEERLRERHGPNKPIALIPSAAREPDRIPTDEERDLDVVYLGDIGTKKGASLLLDAMTHLPGRRLLMHGHGGVERVAELHRRIDELGLSDRVSYGGWIRPGDVPPLLARARASVLPYRPAWVETAEYVSPLKLYELMLCGVPVVTTAIPSLTEVVRDGETALTVPPDDPVAIAGALRKLLDDRPYARRIADAARETAQEYTWRRRAEKVIAFVEQVREQVRSRSAAPGGRRRARRGSGADGIAADRG